MALTLYGISNCDTVRKARRWLDDAGVEYRFHDFRKDGLTRERVATWLQKRPWEAVINRRSSSWKTLDENARNSMNSEAALAAACATPTLIKRPVLEDNGVLEFGFSSARYAELLATD
jgi:Spx/MgsR family transcriptional regulator